MAIVMKNTKSRSQRNEPKKPRFELRIEEGPHRGDLYELEQKTFYHVLDTRTGEIVMTFQGEMEASLSRDTGQWDDYSFSGVKEAAISSDEKSVHLKYYDGREESVPLPKK